MKLADLKNTLSSFLSSRGARLLGFGVSLVLIVLIIRALYLERHQLALIQIDRDFLLVGGFCVFVVVIGNLLGSIGCWSLLKRHSGEITVPYSITINGLAQMAKYVPGNVLHLVGRFYLISRLTTAKTAFVFSVFEVALLCLSGCSIGLLYLHYLQPADWPIPLLVPLSLLLLGTGIFVLLRTRMLDVSARTLGFVTALYVSSFLFYGIAFSALFFFVFENPAGVMLCTTLFALAFVIGYVTPGASGGLGVREFVFMTFAKPLMDPTIAVAAVILFRLFSIAGDLAFAFVALWVKKMYEVRLLRENATGYPNST